MEIDRYALDVPYCNSVDPKGEGEWVLYDDLAPIEAELARLRDANEKLTRELAEEGARVEMSRLIVQELRGKLSSATADVYLEVAKHFQRRWQEDVRHRPDVNVYKAGLDKAYTQAEKVFLDKHNAAQPNDDEPPQ